MQAPRVGRWNRSSDSVDQADTSIVEVLNALELKSAARPGRLEEHLSIAGDQRMDVEAELTDETCIDETRRGPRTADQVDVLARLFLDGGNVVEAT